MVGQTHLFIYLEIIMVSNTIYFTTKISEYFIVMVTIINEVFIITTIIIFV